MLSASKGRDIALTLLFLISREDLLPINLPKATFWGNEFYKCKYSQYKNFLSLVIL